MKELRKEILSEIYDIVSECDDMYEMDILLDLVKNLKSRDTNGCKELVVEYCDYNEI